MSSNGSSTTTTEKPPGRSGKKLEDKDEDDPEMDYPAHHEHPPVLIVMHEIEAEEEIPESSKEVEAVEEIFHHKGWIPIKYRWEY